MHVHLEGLQVVLDFATLISDKPSSTRRKLEDGVPQLPLPSLPVRREALWGNCNVRGSMSFEFVDVLTNERSG